jgi:hypothetical protein
MDGASNDWIARQATEILNEIQPDNIVIQWSYSHRREFEDTSMSDVSRRSQGDATNDLRDTPNLCNNIKMVNDNAVTTNIIHSFIPEFIPNCRIRYDLIIKILSYIYIYTILPAKSSHSLNRLTMQEIIIIMTYKLH